MLEYSDLNCKLGTPNVGDTFSHWETEVRGEVPKWAYASFAEIPDTEEEEEYFTQSDYETALKKLREKLKKAKKLKKKLKKKSDIKKADSEIARINSQIEEIEEQQEEDDDYDDEDDDDEDEDDIVADDGTISTEVPSSDVKPDTSELEKGIAVEEPEAPGAPDVGDAPASLNPTPGGATKVPSKSPVNDRMPSPSEFVKFGKLYTTSSTKDNEAKPSGKEEAAVTPEISPPKSSANYRVPTNEDIECWMHKYWSRRTVPKSVRFEGTLEQFREYMNRDGLVDSGRWNANSKKLMIDATEMWFVIRARVSEYIMYFLDHNISFKAKGLPDPYCFLDEPELTDEQATKKWDAEVKANPLVAIVGSEEPSAADAEYNKDKNTEIFAAKPPPGCQPEWAYRACEKKDSDVKKCRKLKGPARDECELTAEKCQTSPETWCVKRSGFDAYMSFLNKWTNVKSFYLFCFLSPLIMSLVFPPFVIFAPLFMIIAGVSLPLVLYKHFFRILGPGSAIFEAIPYYIRWYFWYPIVLFIAKPLTAIKLFFKSFGRIMKGAISGIVWLFTVALPKLLGFIMKPFMGFFGSIFKVVTSVFKVISKLVMGFIKLIIKFFEMLGNLLKPVWNGVYNIIKGIGKVVGMIEKGISKAIKSVTKFFKNLFR